jgi:hypothetical protein
LNSLAEKTTIFLVADWAELRIQSLQVGMDLVELSADLASFECKKRRTIMLAFHDPPASFDQAQVGDAIIA